jgi:hypothetical protein
VRELDDVTLPDNNKFFSVPRQVLGDFLVEYVLFLHRVREIEGSDLGQKTIYPDSVPSWVLSVLPGKCNIIALNYTKSFKVS